MYPSASGLAALASTGGVTSRLNIQKKLLPVACTLVFNKHNLECTKEVSLNPFHVLEKIFYSIFLSCCIIWIQTTSHCQKHSYYFHLEFERLWKQSQTIQSSSTHTITSLEWNCPIKNLLKPAHHGKDKSGVQQP